MENLTFKIRPFERVIDATGPGPFRASPVLEEGSVAFSIGGSRCAVPTVDRGVDQWGEFAVVEPGEWPLDLSFVLTVEPESSEDEPPGCRVAMTRQGEGDDRERIEAELRRQGIDPDSVNLLSPPSATISIHFNAWGTVNGFSRFPAPAQADGPAQ